ncbi:MAG: hypothetical protein HPY66_3095 [Firmicutes bacterium]|nr:hypothetical protein [Bacillota bacterium]
MIFPDYTQTGMVYHVINVNDYREVRENGIVYNNKSTYKSRYEGFHRFINSFRPQYIPEWVDRTKAIFASMNFEEGHQWHSHSILLALTIDPSRCWIANENKANELYEPFVLHSEEEFCGAVHYLEGRGKKTAEEYWETSLSFQDNLGKRRDLEFGYDAEVMVFHPVKPQDIHYIAIISDHRVLTIDKWKETFCKKRENGIMIIVNMT